MDLSNARFLGYVQLRVGSRLFTVPVQAVHFDRDGDAAPGGLFEEKGQLGIWVDEDASEAERKNQIERASLEAATRIQRKYLN